MRFTNTLGLPQPIVDAVTGDEYSKGDSDISVTGLLSPPRQRVLQQLHDDDITEDVSERMFALMGTAIHKRLEEAADGSGISEERLYMEAGSFLKPWVVSGQFDHLALTPEDGLLTLQDYKTMSVFEIMDGLREEKVQQLNLYAELMRANGRKVEALEVVAIFRDWSKTRARRESSTSNYPPHQVARIPVEMWDEGRAREFMENRVALHQDAEVDLPECTFDERWGKPATYALMKKGNKRAVRLLDSEDALMEYAAEKGYVSVYGGLKPTHYIDVRPETFPRCEDFCSVASFCSQFQESKGEGDDD